MVPRSADEQINLYVARQAAMKERARQIREQRAAQKPNPKVVDDLPKVQRKLEEKWDGKLPGWPSEGPPSSHDLNKSYYYSPPSKTPKTITKSTLSSSLRLLKSLQSTRNSPTSSHTISSKRGSARQSLRFDSSSQNSQPSKQPKACLPTQPPIPSPSPPVVMETSLKQSTPQQPVPPEDDVPLEPLVQCPVCQRKFAQSRIQKHKNVCKKQASKAPRKAFDPTKQRLPEEALEVAPSSSKPTKRKPNKPSWREQRAQLQAAIRSAKQGGEAPPVIQDHRVGCRYCGRKFNEDRIEKHEQVCGRSAKRMSNRGSRGRGRKR
ncbi:hypothetical protein P9112_006694 [Eukaryota sp. TZLM1-RC]